MLYLWSFQLKWHLSLSTCQNSYWWRACWWVRALHPQCCALLHCFMFLLHLAFMCTTKSTKSFFSWTESTSLANPWLKGVFILSSAKQQCWAVFFLWPFCVCDKVLDREVRRKWSRSENNVLAEERTESNKKVFRNEGFERPGFHGQRRNEAFNRWRPTHFIKTPSCPSRVYQRQALGSILAGKLVWFMPHKNTSRHCKTISFEVKDSPREKKEPPKRSFSHWNDYKSTPFGCEKSIWLHV